MPNHPEHQKRGLMTTDTSSAAAPEPEPEPEPRYCGQCGKPTGEQPHDRCAARLELEPPRFCTQCARRMVVQVVPTGWTARCSEHGTTSSAQTSSPVAR